MQLQATLALGDDDISAEEVESASSTVFIKIETKIFKGQQNQIVVNRRIKQSQCQDLISLIGKKRLISIINVEMIDYQYYQGAAIALIVINGISFLALLFVITIYLIRWKKIASFPMRLSFYLCLSCLVQNLYILIYPPVVVYDAQSSGQEATGYCIFESMLKTASDLSSIIWTLIIIYSSYATVVRGYTLERLELFYLTVGFLLPILLALIPIFLNLYGYNYYFCWFNTETPSTLFGLKMGYFFAPLWVFFFLQMFFAFRTYQKLKSVGLHGRELNIFKKILMFPIILLVTGFFATADMIYKYASGGFSEWLDVVSILLLSTYGIMISLAYGFNPLIRDQILILFKKKQQSEIRYSTTTETSRKTDQIAELITM